MNGPDKDEMRSTMQRQIEIWEKKVHGDQDTIKSLERSIQQSRKEIDDIRGRLSRLR